MYITKSGVIQKIDEDAWPSWRDEGWAIDQDRDGTADSLSGGGDTSGLLPIADPTGVTSDDTYANEVKGSGTIAVAVFPADATVIAVKIEGDEHPRFMINVDPTDWGAIFLGDGTSDPMQGTAYINSDVNGIGGGAMIGMGGLVMRGDIWFRGHGPALRAPDNSFHRIKVGNDGTLSTEVAT